MYDASERNRLAREELAMQKAREARAEEEFGWRRDAEARQRAKDTELDSYTQQLTRPNAENYAFAPRGGTGGMGLRAPMPADAADTASVPPVGLRMPAEGAAPAAAGLRAPAMGDRPLTFNEAPTGAAAEELLGKMAILKGDTAGFRASQVAAKGYKYEDVYKTRMAEWNAMKDEDKAALIDRLSYDTGVKGFGTWVPGKGKTAGYMNYMPPNGDPIKLSAKEAGDLYALTNLMEIDPTRARAEMDKVSDKVRAVAAQAFDATSKGVTANNQATRFANADDISREELGIKRGAAAAQSQYYKDRGAAERMGSAQYFTGADGNTYASIPRLGKNGLQFETVRVNPEGVKLSKVGGTGDNKPVEAKEEGTKYTIGGKLYYSDGLGGWIPDNGSGKPAGVLPSQRQQALKAAGVPDNFLDKLQWNADGTAVGYNGMRFSINELKDIPKELQRIERNTQFAEEDSKRSMGLHGALRRQRDAREQPVEPRQSSGFGPTINFRPDPNAPSIYAGPEEWEAYRQYQNR